MTKSERGDVEEDTLKRLIALRAYLSERIDSLREELNQITGFYEALDGAIASLSFRSPVMPSMRPAPLVKESERPKERRYAQVIQLKSRSGILLAKLMVGEGVARIVPEVRLNVSTPPFQSFMINRILEPMRQRDRERVSMGEIHEEEALTYNVVIDGEDLKEVIIRNFRDQRRLREIRSSARWALEKMYEKTANP